MNSPWLQGIFLVCTLLFFTPTIRVIVILMRLLAALSTGTVKWPGPIVHDPNPNAALAQQRMGLKPDRLFSAFVQNSLGLIGAFVFFLLSFLSGTSWFAGYIQIQWTGVVACVSFLAFIGGIINSSKANRYANQVHMLLSDLASGAEPRHKDRASAEAEYAIEHPLLDVPMPTPELSKALQLFSDGTAYLQDGNQQKGLIFYQEALKMDPALHEHARDRLSLMAKEADLKDVGAIYYWLGAHSEYLMDWTQAKAWYEKAIVAFSKLGYKKRESRVHCNLGNVKMRIMDGSAMDEFEKAIELNPRNGTAHINIGTTYYQISERGNPRFERALDAYADAIIADPIQYGPIVISRLREIGYTWKEDLEDITQRVEEKRRKSSKQSS